LGWQASDESGGGLGSGAVSGAGACGDGLGGGDGVVDDGLGGGGEIDFRV
jgi:hypothetical protein